MWGRPDSVTGRGRQGICPAILDRPALSRFYSVNRWVRPVAYSAFLRDPDRVGRRKNSAGSTSRMVANFSMILQAHVGHSPLDPTEVGPVNLGIMGQLLLR